MKKKLSKFKIKLRSFFRKFLTNSKDIDLNNRIKNEAEYKKMYEKMKTY